MLKQFFQTYSSLSATGNYPNNEQKIKFKQYIDSFKSIDKNKQEIYWKKYLNGYRSLSDLPEDERDITNISLKKNLKHVLDIDQIKEFTNNNKVTLASLLFTSWGVLLQRYFNSKDVIFGTPVSGRNVNLSGIENTIGNFVNTLPLRIFSRDDINSIELVESVHNDLQERSDHDQSSIVDIARYIEANMKNGLFKTIFVIDDYPIDKKYLQGNDSLSIEGYQLIESTNFDLTVSVREEDEHTININYNSQLYSDSIIEKMLEHYMQIIEQIIQKPTGLVSRINISTDFVEVSCQGLTGKKVKLPHAQASELFEEQAHRTPNATALTESSLNELYNSLTDIWKEILYKNDIDINNNFFDLGGNSLLILRMVSKLNKMFEASITVTTIFRYPTIKTLAEYIYHSTRDVVEGETETNSDSQTDISVAGNTQDIAVIGMACRFPGAPNIRVFWDNLKNGVESITFFNDEELLKAGIDKELINNPAYVKAKGIVNDIELFDANFFGYSPKEAKIMDPQMRALHECAWEVLEDAGYASDTSEKNIGIFLGASNNFFWMSKAASHSEGSIGQYQTNILNDRDFMATHLSYKFNLTGPSIVIQSACSTSLVSVDAAIQNINLGKCKMAIAGGVSITYPQKEGYMYHEGMINSPDGHCKAFDKDASGTVQGAGVGLVMLKSLESAIEDGDHVYAVIKGSAVNNDGSSKIGYTAPSINGQVAVIREAFDQSGVKPESISYIETHGTATALGDPIEVEALTNAFQTEKKQFCAIGSVKTNIGHLDVAAGIAGLIKTILSLKNKAIPPTLHYTTANPKIDFDNSPFYVNKRLVEWKTATNEPRRAGVSSFGIGGTNAHIILEEAPEFEQDNTHEQQHIFLLSGKTSDTVQKLSSKLLSYLEVTSNQNLLDVTYTLNVGRKDFEHRQMFVATNQQEAINILTDLQKNNKTRNVLKNQVENKRKSIAFLFPGIGTQYANMGKDLYDSIPYLRMVMDKCFSILEKVDPTINYKALLFSTELSEKEIIRTTNAQFSIFIMEYSLAKLLIHWGIHPSRMLGYSFGEYVAACIAGVFSLEEALKIIFIRGQLLDRIPEGAMLSIPLTLKETISMLVSTVSVAVDNGQSCVISGKREEMELIESKFLNKRIICKFIPTSHAFHSSMLAPIISEFATAIKNTVNLNKPKIPYVSNVTGKWVDANLVTDPNYWARHMVETVRFKDSVETLLDSDDVTCIEIGPGNNLSQLLNRFKDRKKKVVNLMPSKFSEINKYNYLMQKIGVLWLNGNEINWEEVYKEKNVKRVSLPTYPFERAYHWLESTKKENNNSNWFSGKNSKLEEWFYMQTWERSINIPKNRRTTELKTWLVFQKKNDQFSSQIFDELMKANKRVILVEQGNNYLKLNENHYQINPACVDNFADLISDLISENLLIDVVLHCWELNTNERNLDMKVIDSSLESGFYSLVNLVQAMGIKGINNDISIKVLTNNLYDVVGGEGIRPEKATILGPLKVIPLEYPNINCSSIDIVLPLENNKSRERLVKDILNEINNHTNDKMVAYRGRHRWIPVIKQVQLESPPQNSTKLRKNGVYMITGGLGGIGLNMASYIASEVPAKLVLVGRSAFPPRSEWDRYESSNNPIVYQQIRKLKEIIKAGSEVLVISADVSERDQMISVIERVRQCFGSINGVLHNAGVAEYDGIIQNKTKENMKKVLSPKIKGTYVLHSLLKDLDFFGISSSLAPILYHTKVGQLSYCTANEFIDYFVNYHKTNYNEPIFSINWASWIETGMSVESSEHWGEKLNLKNAEIIHEEGLLPDEGIQVLKTVLENDYAQFIVSPENLITKIDSYEKTNLSLLQIIDEASALQSSFKRAEMSTKYLAPTTSMEKKVAQIWFRIFGDTEIGVLDDFFELGGDSLQALNTIAKIHEQMGLRIGLSQFYECSNIKSLSNYLDGVGLEESNQEQILINQIEEQEYYEVSSAQNRMFILNQIDMESTNYNMAISLIINGKIDFNRMNNALHRMIERHESLRTSFEYHDGKVVQKINANLLISFEEVKGSERDLSDIVKGFNRPFDLMKAPLFRAGILQNTENRTILIFNIHHIISDGLSNNIFIKDLASFYNNNMPEPLKFQYKEYVYSQTDKKKTDDYLTQEKYWLQQFKSDIPKIELPVDFKRPFNSRREGSSFEFYLDKATTNRIRKFAIDHHTTNNTLLISIFYVFLSKISNQEDIIVGSPVSGRNHSDMENVIGMFINTLPIRNYPEGGLPFSEFLSKVSQRVIQCYQHQEYPLDELLQKLQIDRELGRNPLFDVMFGFQAIFETIQFDGFECSPYRTKVNESQFDLTLDVLELENMFRFTFEYSTALFKEETIIRFSDYYKNIVSIVLESPEIKLADVEVLSSEEHQFLLTGINPNYDASEEHSPSILKQIEAFSISNPDQVALYYNGEQLTYYQLNQQANQLASCLRERGITRNSLVPLMTDHCLEMIVGMLGILKAGGAYVPIDMDAPLQRQLYVLNDVNAELIVTTQAFNRHMEILLEHIKVNHIVYVDLELPASYFMDEVEDESKPEDLIYVMYTSGTTGEPKGVMVTQSNIHNLVSWMKKEFGFGLGTNSLLMTKYFFDPSAADIYSTLTTGGTLFLIDKYLLLNKSALREFMNEHQIHFINESPVLVHEILRGEPALPDLKQIIVGGERLNEELATDLLDLGYSVYNHYGTTEVTVDALSFKCSYDQRVSLGRPIQNYQVYILNKYKKLVPIGVPGEIYIGGVGVSKGYLNRNELTSEKFIENPFGLGRLYKTGDIGFVNSEYNFEFIGRNDHQVKINGIRVELEEIESYLMKHPQITQAIVHCKTDEVRGNYLCAYFTSDSQLADSEVRDFLFTWLPLNVIPSYIMQVDQFFKTSNGKTDRSKVPEIKIQSEIVEKLPSGDVEYFLCGIWEDILMREVSVHDNFFSVGGSSLLLIRMKHLLEEKYSFIQVVDLFMYPTISKLALFIEQTIEKNKKESSSVITIKNAGLKISSIKPSGNSGIDHHAAEYSVDLTEELISKLENIRDTLNLEYIDIFLSVFAIMLQNESNIDYFKIQVLNNNMNRVDSISLNFNSIDSFDNLFKTVNKLLKSTLNENYDISEISKTIFDESIGNIIPFLYGEGSYHGEFDLSRKFDLIICVPVTRLINSQIIFTFNELKFESDLIGKMMQSYLNLLYRITSFEGGK